MKTSGRLFLFDAYALIYRAFYAFIRNPRYNSKGLNTSAIFGFTNSLLDIITKEKPTHLAVVFDTPVPTFRHEIFPEYKATRQETPEDILKSIPYIRQIIEAMNISVLEFDGFEADDVIGTIANKASKENFTVFMVTPDKDFGQLVTENIFIYKPGKGGNDNEIWGISEVCKQFEIENPTQVIDILSLWGDASDNIPGAPGIGEKTAKKLISEYHSVEELLKNTNQLSGKIKETLQSFADQVLLSKQLATIHCDVPIDFDADDLQMNEPDFETLKAIFDELEFKTLIDRLINKPKKPNQPIQQTLFPDEGIHLDVPITNSLKTIDTVPHEYILADTYEKRKLLIDKLLNVNEFCFDTETTSLDTWQARLVGMSFCFKTNEAYYIPFPEDRTEESQMIEELKPIFERDSIAKIGQNMKYDMMVLMNYGLSVQGKLFDTMIAHYLVQPELRHNLDYLSEQYLNYSPVSIETLIGKKGKDQRNMRSVEMEKIKEYACEDADLTWQLKPILQKELEKNKLTDLFLSLEMPLVKVLADMERAGFNIDIDCLNNYAKNLNDELIKIESEIYQLAGITFNISSPKQLGEVLFDRLKLDPTAKKTKTLQYSTGEEILLKLYDRHPIINQILEYRSVKKLLNTYVEALPGMVNPVTGKIHSSFNQTVTATGRLSSANPNLQNIPIREERGREIRKAFVSSSSEHLLLAADYSQIELRLMAHLSNDESMREAFMKNEDIHVSTAAKINHIPIHEVTKEMRRQAKTANFGIIYGISSFGLAQRLNISRSEAKALIDGYFKTFPGVKVYMENCIRSAREKGFVETIMGRKRFLADINSRNQTVRGFAERNAINAPIQGSAADIIKLAMIRIHQKLKENNLKTSMILQVHDELVFDVPLFELEKVKEIVKTEMEKAVQLSVPLVVDMGTGTNWLEAH